MLGNASGLFKCIRFHLSFLSFECIPSALLPSPSGLRLQARVPGPWVLCWGLGPGARPCAPGPGAPGPRRGALQALSHRALAQSPRFQGHGPQDLGPGPQALSLGPLALGLGRPQALGP